MVSRQAAACRFVDVLYPYEHADYIQITKTKASTQKKQEDVDLSEAAALLGMHIAVPVDRRKDIQVAQ